MPKQLWRHLLSLVMLGLILTGCGGGDPAPARPQTTTLLVYMVGSDLESGHDAEKGTADFTGNATINLQEMLKAAGSDRVNVVLTTGGALKDDPANLGLVKSWRTLKRHVLKNGKLEELADLGRANMGAPDTLTDFIKWAKTAYPADRYMIAFWNHGGGNYGFGGDENWGGSALSVSELAGALRQAQQATGITFDFIAFDACLMATVEVANALSPYARYMGASQELEPGTGWDWTAVLNVLAQNPDVDVPTLGRTLADAFIAKQNAEANELRKTWNAAYQDERYNTFSIVDLARIPPVMAELEKLAAALLPQITTPEGWLEVAKARVHAMSFGGNANKDTDSFDLADLYGFGRRLEQAGIAADASRALQAAVRNAVIHRNTGDLVTHSANGLSVFFPSRSLGPEARKTLGDTYKSITSPNYNRLLDAYLNQTQLLPHAITIVPPTIVDHAMQSNITASLGIKEAYAILSRDEVGGKIIIDGVMRAEISGYGGASAVLNKGWPTLNGYPFAIVASFPESDEDGDIIGYRYIIPILRNGIPTSLEAREDKDGLQVIGTWEGIGTDQMAARAGDPILPNDDVTLLRVVLDVDTQAAEVTPTPMAVPFKAGNMMFSYTGLPANTYKLRFAITDFAENDKFSDAVGYTVP